jgi:DNA-binding transcriptional regulator YiaG
MDKKPSKPLFYTPTAAEVAAERELAGLTQKEAAELVCASANTWQKWEAPPGTVSHRAMHPGFWKLFRLEIKSRSKQ